MDRELAGAVLSRWESGLPVSETNLYKAAAAMGIDPMAALVEARFYTYFDSYLMEKRAMTRKERHVFSAAAGLATSHLEKTASSFGFSPDTLIVETLRNNNFVPNLIKIANLTALVDPKQQQPMMGADPSQGQPQPGADPSQGQNPMMADPQQGAQLQQQPQARMFKPSPTAPEQAMPSPMGNMDELLQSQQQAFQDPGMQGNGGQPPAAGMPQPAPPPPSPEERIQQVGPNLDPEAVSRYADQLTRFEQGMQQQISDPKQMVKFVKELQKIEAKRIDQGIKAMGQQLEQEQAQELGVDGTPTIDGGMAGGQQVLAPKQPGSPPGPGGGQPPTGGPPQPGAEDPMAGPQSAPQGQDQQAQSKPGAEGPIPGQSPSPPQKPKQGPPPAQQAAQMAVEKVAHVARLLARTSFNR